MTRVWRWLIAHWPTKEAVGLVVFFTLLLASLYTVVTKEMDKAASILDTIRVVVPDLEPYVVVSGAIAYGSTEGGAMIAEAFMKKREKRGEERGEKRGREEAEAKWREWYEANREHINGATPPPFEVEEKTP